MPAANDAPPTSQRHPLFGWMRGLVTIAPGVDLTEPADPDWADIAEAKAAAFMAPPGLEPKSEEDEP